MCKLSDLQRRSTNAVSSPPASPSISPGVLDGLKVKNTFLYFDIQKIYFESLGGEDIFDDEVTCIRRRCITEPACPEKDESESYNMSVLSESDCSTAPTAVSSPRSANDPIGAHADARDRSNEWDRKSAIVEPSEEVEMMRVPSENLQYAMPVFMSGALLVANTGATWHHMDEMANFWLKRAEDARLAVESLRTQIECKTNRSSLGAARAPESQAVDIAELPSAGSSGHSQGLCKPCAWFHSSKGCNNGSSCEFCHACGPREVKKRRKERARLLAARNS